MANKKTRKNNAVVEWPENTHFTIKDMFVKYPDFVKITIRFRIKRGLENKEIVVIGKMKPEIGRPQLVFAKTNPSQEVLTEATKAGVLPIKDEQVKVSVADVVVPKSIESVQSSDAVVPIVETESTVV
jgi:hypothetical protein